MIRGIHKRISLVAIAVMAILAWLVHALLHVNFWLAFGFVFLGIVINGIVATFEDNAPGGFNNPRQDPPEKDQ
jgi:hypothetical protein